MYEPGADHKLQRTNSKCATILIGPQNRPFVIPSAFVESNRYLKESVSYRDQDGERAMVLQRHCFKKVEPGMFKCIADWMNSGQYKPEMQEDRFEPTLSKQRRLEQMRLLTFVFDMARSMMIFEIFKYLGQRYKALKPWPARQLIELIFVVLRQPSAADDVEDSIRNDLILTVSENYEDIADSGNAISLHDILAQNPVFAKFVFDLRFLDWKNNTEHMANGEHRKDENGPDHETNPLKEQN